MAYLKYMQNRDQQFLKKISTQAEELQYFFESSVCGVSCRSLGADYKVSSDVFVDLINLAFAKGD